MTDIKTIVARDVCLITQGTVDEYIERYGPQYRLILDNDNRVHKYDYLDTFSSINDRIEKNSTFLAVLDSVSHQPKGDFFCGLGFEITFVQPKGIDTAEKASVALCKMNYDAMKDGGALEVRSPVFHEEAKLVEWLGQLYKDVENLGMDFKTHHGYRSTGGGHIHIDFTTLVFNGSSETRTFKQYLKYMILSSFFSDIWNRPYLNWIFNDWCDNKTANHFIQSKSFDTFNINVNRNYDFNWTDGSCCLRWQPENGNVGTLEFRIFDSPRSTDEVVAQARFLSAWYKKLWSMITEKKGIQPIYDKILDNGHSALKVWYPRDKAIMHFMSMLNNLDLDPTYYRFFINENYLTRIKENTSLW
jgi:hypothetical protein